MSVPSRSTHSGVRSGVTVSGNLVHDPFERNDEDESRGNSNYILSFADPCDL